MTVPFSAGASSDAVGRLLAQKMGDRLGQPVVVDNRPGAGATIGAAAVAKKGQQGYAVLLADSAHTIAPALYDKLPYDPVGDFTVIGFVGRSPAVLYTSASSGLKTIRDVLAHRQRAGAQDMTIGAGNGTASHLISSLFQRKAGVALQMVPYKGASPALADLAAGHIELVFTSTASAGPFVASGRLLPLAQAGADRDRNLGSVPTLREVGVDMLASYWFAVLMPSDTPEPVVSLWRKELAGVLASPEVTEKLSGLSINKIDLSTAQAVQLMKGEVQQWKDVSRTAQIKLN
jgi:tripartite-type tricarboxylate transporter receptor subunit TctC